MISIIIPTSNNSLTLSVLREDLLKANNDLEIIIVGNESLSGELKENHPSERIIFSKRKGRGYQLFEGIKIAQGDIALFLHDDTCLPEDWDKSILEALENNKVIGGAFSLKFNINNRSLSFLIFLSDLFYKLTGELWGDRGIFIKSKILKEAPEILNVPIMEDVKLSHYMRKQGKTVMLKKHVTTDAKTFLKRGIVRHAFLIVLCRFLFAINFRMNRIYNLYYS